MSFSPGSDLLPYIGVQGIERHYRKNTSKKELMVKSVASLCRRFKEKNETFSLFHYASSVYVALQTFYHRLGCSVVRPENGGKLFHLKRIFLVKSLDVFLNEIFLCSKKFNFNSN